MICFKNIFLCFFLIFISHEVFVGGTKTNSNESTSNLIGKSVMKSSSIVGTKKTQKISDKKTLDFLGVLDKGVMKSFSIGGRDKVETNKTHRPSQKKTLNLLSSWDKDDSDEGDSESVGTNKTHMPSQKKTLDLLGSWDKGKGVMKSSSTGDSDSVGSNKTHMPSQKKTLDLLGSWDKGKGVMKSSSTDDSEEDDSEEDDLSNDPFVKGCIAKVKLVYSFGRNDSTYYMFKISFSTLIEEEVKTKSEEAHSYYLTLLNDAQFKDDHELKTPNKYCELYNGRIDRSCLDNLKKINITDQMDGRQAFEHLYRTYNFKTFTRINFYQTNHSGRLTYLEAQNFESIKRFISFHTKSSTLVKHEYLKTILQFCKLRKKAYDVKQKRKLSGHKVSSLLTLRTGN